MLEITKKKREHGYSFFISTDEGQFEISFEGNLDLYWANLYHGSLLEEPASKSFTITKENYYLYSLFAELYEDVKNCNVFKLDEIDISLCEDEKEIEAKRIEKESFNKELRNRQKYNPERLFRDGVIEWHCDDFPYEESSILKIEKEGDTFVVTFEKSKEMNMYLTYSVRFRNSGSRYTPFNIIFMKMYNKLINYEPEYHQVNIEEYLYQKKLKKKNN